MILNNLKGIQECIKPPAKDVQPPLHFKFYIKDLQQALYYLSFYDTLIEQKDP